MTNLLNNLKILENNETGRDNYLLKLEMNENCKIPGAGQFYLLKCRDNAKILKRPISLHYVDKKNGILEFVYKITGKGTKEISSYKAGSYIEIQGPLGKGFDTELKDQRVVLTGGGIGLAPMKQTLEDMKKGNTITLIAGGKDEEALKILSNFNTKDIRLIRCTDDGSTGEKGTVAEMLEHYIKDHPTDIIYTCGPYLMMEKISEIAKKNNIKCEVSLEERMACGVKACVGCSVRTSEGMRRVCYDGPVFDSKIIFKHKSDNGIQ